MFQRTFNKILKSYALIDGNGNYKKISNKDKKTIERIVFSTLDEVPVFKLFNSQKIFIKEGIDEFNGFKIYIYNNNFCDSTFKRGLFLVYSFANDGSKVTLSINLGRMGLDPVYFQNIVDKFKSSININKMNKFTKKINSYKDDNSEAIILISYNVKELQDTQLREDLRWLYEKYFNLCNDYRSIVKKIDKNKQKKKKKRFLMKRKLNCAIILGISLNFMKIIVLKTILTKNLMKILKKILLT